MLTTFNGNLSCPLDFGHYLVIVGKTIDGAKQFQINLRSGKEKTSEIGLHLSLQFTQDVIIRNSMINGEWGEEENFDYLDSNTITNPISPGDFFIVCIFVGEKKFHISINNRPYCTYKFRLPIEIIRNVELHDSIQTIKQIDHRKIFPIAWPPIQTINSLVSFSHDCPNLFNAGHVIVITARCFGNLRGQFTLSFFDSDTHRELLHFNVRFRERVVVRNCMKSNLEFMGEERDCGFPFNKDDQFNLAIAFTKAEFLFAINGHKFTSFGYKTSNLLQILVGFKIFCGLGLQIHVTEIDHIQMQNSNCVGYEVHSL